MTCIEVVGFLLIFKICLCGQLLRWTTWCFLINIRCLCDVLTSHVFDLKWDINFDTDAIAGKSIKKWKHYSFTYITYIKTNFVINKNTSIWFLLFLFCIHVVYELLLFFYSCDVQTTYLDIYRKLLMFTESNFLRFFVHHGRFWVAWKQFSRYLRY